MASGTIDLGSSGAIKGRISWSSSSNGTAANSSTVTATIQVQRPDGFGPTMGTWTGSLNIGGTSKSYSKYAEVSTSWVTLYSFSVTKAHNSDGSGTCYISGNIHGPSGTSQANSVVSKGATVTLDKIPRAASLTSAPDFNDENDPTINYSNPAGNSVDTLKAGIYGTNGSTAYAAYRDISKTGTSYTFSLTDAERAKLRNAIPNSKSLKVRFYVQTVISGTTYTSYLERTMTIVGGAPTLSPTIVDTNSKTTALTGDANKIVKYYSNAKVTFGASAKKGASIASKSVNCGGKTLSEDGTINAVESNNFAFTVTDTRGNSFSDTIPKTLIPYVKLTCELSNNKPNASGVMTVLVSGNYFNGSFGAVSNTLEVWYRYKTLNGQYPDTWPKMKDSQITKSGNTYTATASLTGLDYQTTYVFQACARDKLTGDVYTVEKQIKAQPVFDWGENDFKFNVKVGLDENTGITIPDLRDATPSPDMFGGRVIAPYFFYDGGWQSILHVKGWNGAYAAWEMSVPADTNNASSSIYHRAGYGNGGSFGAWKKILDSSNYASAIAGTHPPVINITSSNKVGFPCTYGAFGSNKGNKYGSAAGDCYYWGVDANGDLWAGIQLNNATSITWYKCVTSTDGVVKIYAGGTGATNATQAKRNFGIYQATAVITRNGSTSQTFTISTLTGGAMTSLGAGASLAVINGDHHANYNNVVSVNRVSSTEVVVYFNAAKSGSMRLNTCVMNWNAMRVYLDENGYVYLHAGDDEYCEGDFKTVPDEYFTDHFLSHRKCYRFEDGKLVYDEDREETVRKEERMDEIRRLREVLCYPIVNRGWLWYQDLTPSRLIELTKWYKSWLDAPATGVIPEKPEWIE